MEHLLAAHGQVFLATSWHPRTLASERPFLTTGAACAGWVMTNERSLLSRPRGRVAVLALAAVAAMTLFLLAFAYPATNQAPRHLPIVVAGPPAAVAQVEARLDAEDGDAFDVVRSPTGTPRWPRCWTGRPTAPSSWVRRARPRC
jgi:hypothetical protein